MKRKIRDFTVDDEGHWVALLACGHRQHVRHDPPLTQRPLVLTAEGRSKLIGYELECRTCNVEGARDEPTGV